MFHFEPEPIPVKQIPEGMMLCLKNCNRYYEECKLLEKNQKYESAVLMILLGIEEFAKAQLLLDHFRDKKHVSKKEVRQYFRLHQLRFSEFSKRFMSSLPGSSISFPDSFHKNVGQYEQYYKEKMMYVDWLGHNWYDPLTGEGVVPFASRSKNFYKVKLISAKSELQHLICKMHEDPAFQEAKMCLKQDNVTMTKLKEMIKEHFNHKKIPTKTEFTPKKKEIKIKIKPINSQITKNSCKELEEKIVSRFPDYNVDIKISQKKIYHI